jgi:hypothetical protein
MADKKFDPEDPMEFMGVGMASDAAGFQAMVDTIIEEYVLMGWSDALILKAFTTPFYQLTYAVYQQKGEPYVLEAIARVREAWSPKVKE